MVIRKLFKFEGAHIVRNCSSDRCKHSIHGHSYIVEVFIESKGLDNGQMVMDFGLMKGTIKDFIDGFDHSYSMWNKESLKFKNFIYEYSDRVIEMPVSPSAESYSLMFLYVIDKIIKATKFNNGEKKVKVKSVRVHETATGYAESFRKDLKYVDYNLNDIELTKSITDDFKYPNMINDMYYSDGTTKLFINDVVTQQVK